MAKRLLRTTGWTLIATLATVLCVTGQSSAIAKEESEASSRWLISTVQTLCMAGDADPEYALRAADEASWYPVSENPDWPMSGARLRGMTTLDGYSVILGVNAATTNDGVPINMCTIMVEPSTSSGVSLFAKIRAWIGFEATTKPAIDRHNFMFTVDGTGKRSSVAGLSQEQLAQAKREGRVRVLIAWWQPEIALLQYSAPVRAFSPPTAP